MIYEPKRWAGPTKGATALEPVPLEVFKAHYRIDDADEDALIAEKLRQARELVEQMANRQLITSTYTYQIDGFPTGTSDLIQLPGGTLQSVTSISYVDGNGDTQTWGSSNYDVDTRHVPGRIGLAYNRTWPTIRDWGLPVTITYVAGYGDNPADVPEALRGAIEMIAAELLEHREESVTGASIAMVPIGAKRMAYGKRVHSFH